MAVVESKQFIHAPRDEVYLASQDYDHRTDWDPYPDAIRLEKPELGICVNQHAFIKSHSGLSMEVEFIQVSPRSTSIRMVHGPFFLDRFAGSWLFEDRNGITFARFKYVLTLKKWMLPWLTEWLAGWYFQKQTDKRLAALKAWCESRRSGQVQVFQPQSPCAKH